MKKNRFITVVIVFIIFCMPSLAATWTLSWIEPDDNRVVGYKIYYGYSADDINNGFNVGDTDHVEMIEMDLASGWIYFEAVSLDSEDNESLRSETLEWENFLCGNGWTRVESNYYLGSTNNENADYDGDGTINQEDPDIDGDGIDNQAEIVLYGDAWDEDTDLDGTINIFDEDSDNDGILDGDDSHPLLDPRLGYVDHLYIIESGDPVRVALNHFEVSQNPYCECVNTENGQQRNISYANSDYFAISAENRGNLDGENGVEVAVTLEDKNTSETTVEIRDIQTGELYDPAYCDINIVEHQYFMDDGTRKLAILGFCEATQRTLVRIINAETRNILQEINFLDSGEHPLGMGIYDDVDGDGSPDIAVAPIPSTEPIEIINILTEQQITFE